MKQQVLFSSKDKKLKCRLLQFLFGALKVNHRTNPTDSRFALIKSLNLQGYTMAIIC